MVCCPPGGASKKLYCSRSTHVKQNSEWLFLFFVCIQQMSFWFYFILITVFISLRRNLLNLDDNDFCCCWNWHWKASHSTYSFHWIHSQKQHIYTKFTVTSELIGLFTFLRRMHSIYVQNFQNLFSISLKTFSDVNFY